MASTVEDEMVNLVNLKWRLHGDGKTIAPGEVVAPDERLSWPRSIGIGAQHVLAMFGATFLVPLLTGFSPTTTLFFSGIGTLVFLVITGNRLPSYLGSSFAFIAPVLAATASHGPSSALGGLIIVGALFAIVGVIVMMSGTSWIEWLMPPVVTGTIVALIGLNLAPAAKSNFATHPFTAFITLLAIILVMVLFRGIIGRLSILVGAIVGYLVAWMQGQVHFDAVKHAKWFGLPDFTAPSFHSGVIVVFLPVVLVLIAENVGHVKAVASMTGKSLDGVMGRAFIGDGVATMIAGAGGGSGTTTYAENIGVMAATRIYSTAPYWFAGLFAFLVGLCPKVGALITTMPAAVLGGATVALYGMIGVLGARIWVNNRVNFANPANLMPAAVGLVVGVADFTWKIGDMTFTGIALGAVATVVVYHLMAQIGTRTGVLGDPVAPAPAPVQREPADA
jgi:uracil-xanthine permease